MALPLWVTTRRLLLFSVAALVVAGIAGLFGWAGVDLGFVWCDGRFGPLEKPGCRLPWVFLMVAEVSVVLAAAAGVVVVARGVRVWRKSSRARRQFRP
jgi:hypothetical protein